MILLGFNFEGLHIQNLHHETSNKPINRIALSILLQCEIYCWEIIQFYIISMFIHKLTNFPPFQYRNDVTQILTYLKYIVNNSKYITGKENYNNTQQHSCQSYFFLLQSRKFGPFLVSFPYLKVDLKIEYCQTTKGEDIHYHCVHPRCIYTENK